MGIELPPAISSALAQLPFLSSIGSALNGDQRNIPLVLGTVVVVLATSSVLKFYNGLKVNTFTISTDASPHGGPLIARLAPPWSQNSIQPLQFLGLHGAGNLVEPRP
jgi:hypothetical protein